MYWAIAHVYNETVSTHLFQACMWVRYVTADSRYHLKDDRSREIQIVTLHLSPNELSKVIIRNVRNVIHLSVLICRSSVQHCSVD